MERKERRRCSGAYAPLRRHCFPLCKNVKHAVSMYAQEADLTQRELTTEVWSEPLKCCDTMLCGLRSHDHLHSVTACFLFGCLDLPLGGAFSSWRGWRSCLVFSFLFHFVWWVSLTGGVLWRSPLSTSRVQCLYHITHLSLLWCK